jgi:hypothetical protein
MGSPLAPCLGCNTQTDLDLFTRRTHFVLRGRFAHATVHFSGTHRDVRA